MADAALTGNESPLEPGAVTLAEQSGVVRQSRLRVRPADGLAALATILYVATAGLGVWAAFDPASAWRRMILIGLGVAAMVVIWAGGRLWGDRFLGWVALGCAAAAGALGAYFLLTYDWAARGLDKVPVLYQLGLLLQARRPVVPVPENLHPNVAASGLVLLICLGAGGLIWAWRRQQACPDRRWLHRCRRGWGLVAASAGLALAIAGLALLFTVARGAWLGLLAGLLAVGCNLLWRRRSRRLAGILAATAVLLLGAALWFAIDSPNRAVLSAAQPGGSNTVVNRLALWQHALDTIRDYPFTGSGLGSTMMVHAVYVMLIHVGFIPHLHNLFLQIAIEQGVFGLAAFLVLLSGAGYSAATWRSGAAAGAGSGALRGGVDALALAAVAALTALVVHGLTDAGLYASRMVPLMFVPIGFGLGLQAAAVPSQVVKPVRSAALLWTAATAIVALVAGALLFLPVTRAAWQTNLGAVEQTRIELSRYHWPTPRFIDQVRRDAAAELAPAIAHYQAALALSPGQAAANRRLGQIELSMGDYEAARQHLEAAYRTAPGQQATRALLGESYAIAGDSEEAVRLWRTVSNQLWWDFDWLLQQSLRLRYSWYRSLGENDRAEGIRQAGVQMGFTFGK